MNVLDAIQHELRDVALGNVQKIVALRVTAAAFEGSPATVPLSPERMRLYPGYPANIPLVEIQVHPDDWIDLARTLRPPALTTDVDGRAYAWGIRIMHG